MAQYVDFVFVMLYVNFTQWYRTSLYVIGLLRMMSVEPVPLTWKLPASATMSLTGERKELLLKVQKSIQGEKRNRKRSDSIL